MNSPDDMLNGPKELPALGHVEFWTELEPDATNPSKFHEVDWCRYARRGSVNATTESKVSRLKRSTVGHWEVLRPRYEAWKENRTLELDGVPLDAWPGILKGAVEVFRRFGILTVEHLAGASDGVIASSGVPGARELQRRARLFLDNKPNVDAAEHRAAQQRENERLKSEIEELRAAIKRKEDKAAEDARIEIPASATAFENDPVPAPDTPFGDEPAPAKRRGRPPRSATAD